MKKPLDSRIEPENPEDKDQKGSPSEINSPALDEKTGKPKNKAVSSAAQAAAICKRHFDRAKDGRLRTAAVIADKYGGSAPFTAQAMKATGQSWRNNFSTNPLGAVVDRSTPQISNPIKQAEYLTYSALPAERENAAEKTRKFRLRTTKFVRSWQGWNDLIGHIGQENYLYGNCAPGWIDDDWRPRAFRYDETFVPEGTGQHASQCAFIVYRQPMLLHDFIQKIQEKDVAEDAGYNWAGCIKAANEAAGMRGDADGTPMEQVDAIREGANNGLNYESDTKIIWLFHLLVREYDGGVTLWTTSQKGGHHVRTVENIHECMEDCCVFFTLQQGNGKFYGSRGAGRQLTNLHIALDRHRNFGMDKGYLAGLPVMIAKNKDLNTVQTTVRTPFMIVRGDVEITDATIEFDMQGHEYLDKSLSGQMEAVAGAFIPPKIDNSGNANTKIEAAQKAERELAVRDGVLGRFFTQFGNMMSSVQRKIYKPENIKEAMRLFEENKAKEEKGLKVITKKLWKWLEGVFGKDGEKKYAAQEESKTADADAVQLIVDLLTDGLSVEDIAELALSPATNNAEEKPEEQDAKTVNFVAGMQGTPLAPYFDARKSAEMMAKINIGEDRAQQLLIPERPDPNIEAYAIREQTQEWLAIMAGEAQPVSSIDNHRIHRTALAPRITSLMEILIGSPTPELFNAAKNAVEHYTGHLMMDTSLTEQERPVEEQQVNAWGEVMNATSKVLEQMAEQAAQAGVPGGAGAVPAPIDGAPPQAGPDGSIDGDLEREKLVAEATFRMEDQKIEHRKLDLKERELNDRQESEAMKMTMSVLQDTAAKEAEAQRQGIADANAEAAREAEAQNPNKPSA